MSSDKQSHNIANQWHLATLAMLAISCEFIYLLYFVRRFPLLSFYNQNLDMGGITQHAAYGFITFVGFFAVLFGLLLIGAKQVYGVDETRARGLVFGSGAVFAVTMSFVYPATAVDVMVYVLHSRIMVHYHQNPIFTTPSYYPHDPLMRLADGWSTFGAPYGPIGIVVNAVPTLFAEGNLLLNLLLIKLMFSALLVASAVVIYLILRRLHPPAALAGALFVLWNPYLLFEVSANGHNDIAMMFVALLALLSLVEGELVLGTVLMVVSALVKYSTALLVPLCVLYCLSRFATGRQKGRYLLLSMFASVVLAALSYVPFWQGPTTIYEQLLQAQRHIDSLSAVLSDLPFSISYAWGEVMGRVLFLVAYLYAMLISTRNITSLFRASFVALLAFLALALDNVEPWYFLWVIVIVPLLPGLAWPLAGLLMGYGAQLYAAFFAYVWVWLGLLNPTNFGVVDIASYLCCFAVPLFAVVLARMGRRRWWFEWDTPPFLVPGRGPAHAKLELLDKGVEGG